MPNWNTMTQQQRIMAIGAAVVLLLAVGLIARALLTGGNAGSTEVPPTVIESINEGATGDTFKPPPELTEQDVKIDEVPEGSKKGVQPTGE